MSRATAVTSEVQEHFRAMLSVGFSRRRAAHLLGFSESTIRNVMRRDEDFARAVLRVERNREILALRNVQDASAKSWRAGKWLLERINPTTYGSRRNETQEQRLRNDVREQTQVVTDLIMKEIADAELRERITKKIRRIHDGAAIIEPWCEGTPPGAADDSKLDRFGRLTWLESLALVEENDTSADDDHPDDSDPDAPWDGPHI